jgi:hypothetical protein
MQRSTERFQNQALTPNLPVKLLVLPASHVLYLDAKDGLLLGRLFLLRTAGVFSRRLGWLWIPFFRAGSGMVYILHCLALAGVSIFSSIN